METVFVSVNEACRLVGLGRTTMYRLMDEGQVETVKIGSRRLVRVASLKALDGAPGRPAT
ncbi:helix-turn-helix domain-containing protein [Novosphingobium sp. G106]|uniref:helix-turn-helix domain-containing protein n=1 Tax=Novosphingobium sp. G106 TaxID=2849500 RepID=UPI001C2DA1DF|nr:helix-turn-helix domain-containing protein [Novosphingobium sp. G106]MBV1690439.1 helix-turn-helix domain-containing protein [Novosphingobium sp. G106]